MAHALEQAIAYLHEQLWTGVRLDAVYVRERSERDGIRPRTLRRAKVALGVISEKDGWDGGWTWRLPERHEDAH